MAGRHYLDHASTSPARPEVIDDVVTWLSAPADAGRVHTEGRTARGAIEEAREQVSELLGCRAREVVFTSGATEAANSAVWGAAARGGPVVCAPIEHSSVRDSAAAHAPLIGWEVDGVGRIVAGPVPEGVSLVNCQWANHEVGTLQPVTEVAGACREAGVLVHTDAAQAVGHVPVDFAASGVDLMSVSAHKFGGPPGIGALVVRRGLRIRPLLAGGEQERGRRGGTENVAAIVGFGRAAVIARDRLDDEAVAARAQTDALLDAATSVPGVVSFGDTESRVPHLVCVGVEGVEAEAVLLGLDQEGVAAHSGSACSSESLEPSPVLAAMGVEAERSLRLSVGWSTTEADVEAFAAAFPAAVTRLRALAT